MTSKIKYKGVLVDGCSLMIPKTQRTRLRKVMGNHDLKTFTEGLELLLELYEVQQ